MPGTDAFESDGRRLIGAVPSRDAASAGAAVLALRDAVLHQRVCGARDEIPALAFLVVLAALGLGWALRGLVPGEDLLGWVIAQVGYGAACLLLVQGHRADQRGIERTAVWAFRINAMVVISGLLWAWVPVWLATQQAPLLQLVAGAVLVGIPLLGVITNRYFAIGQIALVAVFLGAFVAYLGLVSDAAFRLEIAVGCVVYAAMMVALGVRGQSAAVALLTAREQRERLIDQLQRAKEESDAGSRAKSEFIANMSHELRTPLTVVLGMAQLLELSELSAEQRESVTLIERSGQALLSLINHILDLSRIEAGRLHLEHADFDLRRTVDEVRRHLADEARDKGLQFAVRVGDGVPMRVRGDELRLRQVLLNLCDNAVKFTAAGRVELAVDLFPSPAPSGRVVLHFAVSDTGIGMGKGAVAHAFEPFYQADSAATRRFGGTGLGLAISRRLVRLMGGTIAVKSELGRGSTFTFTATFEPGAPAGEAPERAAAEFEGKLPLRVLLVEDDPMNALVGASLLRTLAETVDVLDSGEEAVRAAQAQPYQAIMMDCVLDGGIDGYEAARRIRALEEGGQRRSYIVALTASAMAADREHALASGMDAFIAKPYRLEDLRQALLAAVPAAATPARTLS